LDSPPSLNERGNTDRKRQRFEKGGRVHPPVVKRDWELGNTQSLGLETGRGNPEGKRKKGVKEKKGGRASSTKQKENKKKQPSSLIQNACSQRERRGKNIGIISGAETRTGLTARKPITRRGDRSKNERKNKN